MNSLLSVNGLDVGYTRVPILNDVHLHVAPGEIVGILGANGAGKTTLLRAVAGILPRWAGSICLGDRDLSRAKPWARVRAGLAHVPEGRRVFSAMTVDDNLAVAALAARGRDGMRRDELFEIFPRLETRRRQAAGTLSGGEQQMLAIARALLTHPRLLLVDEMSAGLAPVVAHQLVTALGHIHHRGIGVVLVEQSPELIAEVVDRVYLLERGRVASEGTITELGGADGIAASYLGLGRPSDRSNPEANAHPFDHQPGVRTRT